MTNNQTKERQTPAATKPKAQRPRGTLTEELQRLDGPYTADRVAAGAARYVIRRLALEDTTRTWATLKAVIEEAVALRVK